LRQRTSIKLPLSQAGRARSGPAVRRQFREKACPVRQGETPRANFLPYHRQQGECRRLFAVAPPSQSDPSPMPMSMPWVKASSRPRLRPDSIPTPMPSCCLRPARMDSSCGSRSRLLAMSPIAERVDFVTGHVAGLITDAGWSGRASANVPRSGRRGGSGRCGFQFPTGVRGWRGSPCLIQPRGQGPGLWCKRLQHPASRAALPHRGSAALVSSRVCSGSALPPASSALKIASTARA